MLSHHEIRVTTNFCYVMWPRLLKMWCGFLFVVVLGLNFKSHFSWPLVTTVNMPPCVFLTSFFKQLKRVYFNALSSPGHHMCGLITQNWVSIGSRWRVAYSMWGSLEPAHGELWRHFQNSTNLIQFCKQGRYGSLLRSCEMPKNASGFEC